MSGSELAGIWCEGRDTVTFRAAVSEDGHLSFRGGMTLRPERYNNNDSVLYKFEYADINASENSITGSLRLYSMTELEPERPIYICLQKQQDSNGDRTDRQADGQQQIVRMAKSVLRSGYTQLRTGGGCFRITNQPIQPGRYACVHLEYR